MKRNSLPIWILLSVILALLFSGNVIAGTLQEVKARGKLIVGVKTDFPPFGFSDNNGHLEGLDIDLARALSKELFGDEKAVQFVSVRSGDRISVLASKAVDVVIATMSITEERKKEVDFTMPYFVSGQMILVHDGSRITKYQDLAGRKVATVQGSLGDSAVARLAPAAERIKFATTFEALEALKEHRVEAFVEDLPLIYQFLKKNPGLKVATWQPFSPENYGLAVRKGDKEWLDFVNATLTKMKETGEFDRLLAKWFGAQGPLLRKAFKQLSSLHEDVSAYHRA